MDFRPLILAAALILPGQALAGTASEAVEFFYRSPGSEIELANRDRFEGRLRTFLFANEQAWNERGEVCLDFVPSVDAQDFDAAEVLATLELTEVEGGGEMTVIAEFAVFGQTRRIEWTLIGVAGEWKVTEIASPGDGWRLSAFTCG